MVAGNRGIFTGHRRQVRSGVTNGLYAGFFVHRNRYQQRLRSAFLRGLGVQRDLLIHQQHLLHFRQEARIAALQVIRTL